MLWEIVKWTWKQCDNFKILKKEYLKVPYTKWYTNTITVKRFSWPNSKYKSIRLQNMEIKFDLEYILTLCPSFRL